MDKKSELDCYLYFMWNHWSMGVCVQLFGESLGKHIWSKWVSACEDCGAGGAPALFYSTLDVDTRRTIVERSFNHYNRA